MPRDMNFSQQADITKNYRYDLYSSLQTVSDVADQLNKSHKKFSQLNSTLSESGFVKWNRNLLKSIRN